MTPAFTKTSIIVSTRFSRLRADAASRGEAPAADLAYEALSALAESLNCLAMMLDALPAAPAIDARLRSLRQRTSAAGGACTRRLISIISGIHFIDTQLKTYTYAVHLPHKNTGNRASPIPKISAIEIHRKSL